jgi:hypothetical protein
MRGNAKNYSPQMNAGWTRIRPGIERQAFCFICVHPVFICGDIPPMPARAVNGSASPALPYFGAEGVEMLRINLFFNDMF